MVFNSPAIIHQENAQEEDQLRNLVNVSQGISRHPDILLTNIPNPNQSENDNY